jgi:hypothetical protein
MSQLLTHTLTARWSVPTGWYSKPSKRLHVAANTKGGKWIKELPNTFWGHRTQPTKPTGQSPYFVVYGSEAILPTDVM